MPNTCTPLQAKLIFNTSAGNTAESAQQLAETLTTLQEWYIRPDVFMVRPKSRLKVVAQNAVRAGTKLVIVSGGDGTIEEVAGALVGTSATLGIIPIGTRNNLARSLGIPTDSVADAVALLRDGRRLKIDVGYAKGPQTSRYFLEASAAGLPAALFPAADELQHGHLTRLGDFLAMLVTYPPSHIKLKLDDRHEAEANAHMVVIANMPFMGANFQLAPDVYIDDGLLDVLVFANLSKLDLIGYAMQLASGPPNDSRIGRYRVKQIAIDAEPPMPMTADGVALGQGPLTVEVKRRALSVMGGEACADYLSQALKAKEQKAASSF